jgi:hypothetical protein
MNRGTIRLGALALGLLVSVAAQAQLSSTAPPDAVIERWEQHWTLNDDGSTIYHEKQHVRLNNERAYGEFADPRITYNADTDQLEIISARTRLPDGTYRDLPEYGHVKVSPSGPAGWPAFASIRQHLLVMSGVMPGCVLELEYRIISAPGSKLYLADDVRLDHHYPIESRVISVTTPDHITLNWQSMAGEEAGLPMAVDLRRSFPNLPAVPRESSSPPWQRGGMRVAFTTATSEDAFVDRRLAQLETAADGSALIDEFAEEWTDDLTDPSEKLRTLRDKLAERFSFVSFPVDWWPARPRAASEAFATAYGLPDEAAAVLLALARAADLTVKPGLLVSNDVWLSEVPQDKMITSYVLLLNTGDQIEIWDPQRGEIVRDSHWGGHTVLFFVDQELRQVELPEWTRAEESQVDVAGKITVDADGAYAGDLTVRASGLFVSRAGLRSEAAQKGRVQTLVRHVLPGASVKSFSVETLADNQLAVRAAVSGSPLDKSGPCYMLTLAEHGPHATEVSLPLAESQRTNPVDLAGPFTERIHLVVEWPEAWEVVAQPRALAPVAGDWGELRQDVRVDDHRMTLVRHTLVAEGELPPRSFLELRGPLNELRSLRSRTLLLKP